jgi:type IV pilus assembly protein PilC
MSAFSDKEKILFAKRMGFLMKAGVPILESLNLLKKQMKSKKTARIFERIILDVSGGRFLSSSLEGLGGAFGDFAVNIIRIGEQGGFLSDNLDYLAEELNKKRQMKRKILGAMFYPIFIVCVTLLLALLLTTLVFPKVLPIFASVDLKLPVTTKILIFASRFLISYGVYLCLLALLAAAGFVFLLKRPKFRMSAQKLVLKIPLAGLIGKNYCLSNFCRTSGLLLKGDCRVDEAMHITAAATENLVYRGKIEQAGKFAERGGKISDYFATCPALFPDMLCHMVAIGEHGGNLSETFLYLADMFESEVDDLTKNLSSLVEPALMVFMGLMVGFIAVSIITPIYSVTQRLRP